MLHGDARELEWGEGFDAVLTSPPYPGLIDYHEQHRYAYELLGLDDRRERELGAAASGTSRAALDAYVEGVADVLARAAQALRPGAPVLVVVNDRRDLYPEILERAGLRLERTPPPPREPSHRPPRRRVLRGRPRREALGGSEPEAAGLLERGDALLERRVRREEAAEARPPQPRRLVERALDVHVRRRAARVADL